MTPPISEVTRDGMEALIHRLSRYTHFVRSFKLLLALFAAVLTLAILLYPVIEKEKGMRISFTSIVPGAKLGQTKMMGPRYHGLDKDNQPYNLIAKSATQLDDDTMGLDHPVSDITLKSGAWLSVSGNDGVFKTKERLLDLKGSIEMFNDGGYEFRTDRMHVNVGAKTAVTQDEVKGQGPLGTLKAMSGAEIDGKTSVITFEGPVFVTVYPSQGDKKKDSGTQQGADAK